MGDDKEIDWGIYTDEERIKLRKLWREAVEMFDFNKDGKLCKDEMR